jgi:hypothetical protein
MTSPTKSYAANRILFCLHLFPGPFGGKTSSMQVAHLFKGVTSTVMDDLVKANDDYKNQNKYEIYTEDKFVLGAMTAQRRSYMR